jgi:four helix bundle protein
MAAFTELKVWQLSMSLAESIYALTAGFPRGELYGLTSQMRRASISIPSNIAEGYGREQRGYIINFLRVALGSCRELETQLKLSVRLKFCSEEISLTARAQCDEVGKMLRGLIRSVEADADANRV